MHVSRYRPSKSSFSGPPHPPRRYSRPRPAHDPTKDHRRPLVRLGEDFALAHLEALGFSLLDRNYATLRGELDLIVSDGVTLVFVEVKTQRIRIAKPLTDATPLKWLSSRQLALRRPLALAWLYESAHPYTSARDLRFDAIGILVDPEGALLKLDHLQAIL